MGCGRRRRRKGRVRCSYRWYRLRRRWSSGRSRLDGSCISYLQPLLNYLTMLRCVAYRALDVLSIVRAFFRYTVGNVILHACLMKNMATFEGLAILANGRQTKGTFGLTSKLLGCRMQVKDGA